MMKALTFSILAVLAIGSSHGQETISLPLPDANKAAFSRPAKPPYIGDLGSLVIECEKPALSKNGPASFYIRRLQLSGDGLRLVVTQYRIQAPAAETHLYRSSYELTTATPLTFSQGEKTYVFTRNEEGRILTCDLISPDGSTHRIFPSGGELCTQRGKEG